MQRRWIVLTDEYEGLKQKAVDLLVGAVSSYIKTVLPVRKISEVSEEEWKEYDVIAVGQVCVHPILSAYAKQGKIAVPEKAESYGAYVGESLFNAERQTVLIAGYDEKGVLYGVADFCNRYLGKEMLAVEDHNLMFSQDYVPGLFERALNPWQISESPAVSTRAIWTWGYVIYDYRRFFQNMAKLRLNEVVIWNDFAPINAKEVVKYAHSLGIKVIWGFAWGWGLDCARELNKFTDAGLEQLKQRVLSTYEKEYAKTGADGIYFQSFTELHCDKIGDKLVAEIVTGFVNDVVGDMLEKYPDLHIQFGLHATSVRMHLEYLKKLDKRVYIVWEDCGAFPYAYKGQQIEGFEETRALNNELMALRGEGEKFGAVLKGMTNLDWKYFKHADGPCVIGEKPQEFIDKRQKEKDFLWKIVQGNWLKNAKYAKTLVSDIAKNGKESIVQALVEDGMFENKIMFPVAMYAELLWNPERDTGELVETVAKSPFVKFANL